MNREDIKKWDPDYVKLTPEEYKELKDIICENEYIPADQINWDE